MLATTHRYGVSDRLTGEVHAEASPDVQTVGVGGSVVVPDVGLVGASLAGSHSDGGTGGQISFSLERRSPAFSFGLLSEFNTSEYRSLGMTEGAARPSKTLQAFIGVLTDFGSIGASYLLLHGRGGDPKLEFIRSNASIRIGSCGTFN